MLWLCRNKCIFLNMLIYCAVFAHLGDIVGSVPDYLSKVTISIKQVT